MKKVFIIANWKSNKTISEAKRWLEDISDITKEDTSKKEIIICASFTLLSQMQSFILSHKLPIKLGAQNISPFDEGAYTGEINGRQLKELADYVLIGHSERQKYFSETRDMVDKKISTAKQHNLVPVVCVPNKDTDIPKNVPIVVYEPPASISPGIPDTPENADLAVDNIKAVYDADYVLYGGNVTSRNVGLFTQMPHIDGVLVGKASLDAREFLKIINHA